MDLRVRVTSLQVTAEVRVGSREKGIPHLLFYWGRRLDIRKYLFWVDACFLEWLKLILG